MTLFYRTKNKKICYGIWIFAIYRYLFKKLLDTATKTGLDPIKTASKK